MELSVAKFGDGDFWAEERTDLGFFDDLGERWVQHGIDGLVVDGFLVDSLFEKVLWSLAWTEARDAHFSADLVEGLLLRLDPNFLFEVDGDLNAGRGDLFNGVFHIQNLFSFCN